MAGYSGKPVFAKLGIKPGTGILVRGLGHDYASLVGGLPDGAHVVAEGAPGHFPIIHVFVTRKADLAAELAHFRDTIAPDAAIWVSWPKKAAKIVTDVTEDVIREIALPLGLVDIKVCAVSNVWSGLKLVIRKRER